MGHEKATIKALKNAAVSKLKDLNGRTIEMIARGYKLQEVINYLDRDVIDSELKSIENFLGIKKLSVIKWIYKNSFLIADSFFISWKNKQAVSKKIAKQNGVPRRTRTAD